jgi:hypothetical protein
MTSKRVDKFAIRRRADAVTKERKMIERIDKALGRHHGLPAAAVRIIDDEALDDCATPAMVDRPLPATRRLGRTGGRRKANKG